MRVSACLSVCLSVCLSGWLAGWLAACLSVWLAACLCLCASYRYLVADVVVSKVYVRLLNLCHELLLLAQHRRVFLKVAAQRAIV